MKHKLTKKYFDGVIKRTIISISILVIIIVILSMLLLGSYISNKNNEKINCELNKLLIEDINLCTDKLTHYNNIKYTKFNNVSCKK